MQERYITIRVHTSRHHQIATLMRELEALMNEANVNDWAMSLGYVGTINEQIAIRPAAVDS